MFRFTQDVLGQGKGDVLLLHVFTCTTLSRRESNDFQVPIISERRQWPHGAPSSPVPNKSGLQASVRLTAEEMRVRRKSNKDSILKKLYANSASLS